MKLRVIVFGVATAAAMVIPCLPASASAGTQGDTTPVNVTVDVVTPLPQGISWRDDAFYRGDGKLALPAGYTYRDDAVFGPDGQLVYVPDGKREGLVVAPVACKGGALSFSPVDTTNWLANIINGAFNAARAGVEAAAGIAQAAVGAAKTPGAKQGACKVPSRVAD
jgi:hypothetical protein